MDSVSVELERGWRGDAPMLLAGALLVLAAFLTTRDTDFWHSRDDLLQPLLVIGSGLVIANLALRLLRPRLRVELFAIGDGECAITRVRNLQFSGWVRSRTIRLPAAAIRSVKAFDFYNVGNKAGMCWLCIDCGDAGLFEMNLPDREPLLAVVGLVRNHVPGAELIVDERVAG